jgi:hypothetical protein
MKTMALGQMDDLTDAVKTGILEHDLKFLDETQARGKSLMAHLG